MSKPHKCPVCDGTGLVSRPPGTPGDQLPVSSTKNNIGPYSCKPCFGTGILWSIEFDNTLLKVSDESYNLVF